MISAFERIKTLMKDGTDKKIGMLNRYAIGVKELPGRSFAFLFSTPVYYQGGMPIPGRFSQKKELYYFKGSSCLVEITPTGVTFQREWGDACIRFETEQEFVLDEQRRYLQSKEMKIYPTFNGIAVHQYHTQKTELVFDTTIKSELKPKSNGKYFAYRVEKLRPSFVINAMFAQNTAQTVFSGVRLTSKKKSATQYQITMQSMDAAAEHLAWEANFYEPKLIHDTTVESKSPKANNVFGDVAFLGSTRDFGTQYLYLRFDYDKLSDVKTTDITRVTLHIPYYGIQGNSFQVSAPFARFCSFESNWKNRMGSIDLPVDCTIREGVVSFDLSKYMLTDRGSLIVTNGIVLRMTEKKDYAILATADNYLTPQILEFEYKK